MKLDHRLLALALFAWASLHDGTAQAAPYAVAWKVSSAGTWPAAVAGGALVLKDGNALTGYQLGDGRRLWRKKLAGLRYGAGVIAGGEQYVYVLGSDALMVLDPASGKVKHKRELASPNSVLFRNGAVYVSSSDGILKLDAAAAKELARAKGFRGEIRGADGNHVVIYVDKASRGTKGSPKRLLVVNLETGKKTYQFKLLRSGDHRVIKVANSKMVFIDYSQRSASGENPRKLYYTEADYVHSRKLKDEALSKKYPASYPAAKADTFWAVTDSSGIIFLGSHGSPKVASTLMAYDPAHGRILWTRTGNVLSSGLLLAGGLVWTTIATESGTHAVAYSADDGNLRLRVPLEGSGQGAPVRAKGRVLIKTQRSVYCLAPAPKKERAVASSDTPEGQDAKSAARPGWRTYRDRLAGYVIQLPTDWQLDRSRIKKLGGIRMSIPFVKTTRNKGRVSYLGSLHILTWEAAGRDVDGLWRSVYAQRRRTDPELEVEEVVRVRDVGGTGIRGIQAAYRFKDDKGRRVALKSLCVVANGVAYELRAWAAPLAPHKIWPQVKEIFRTFTPRKFKKRSARAR
jgi:outer membrane protein assembly factor BamB